MNKKQLIVLSAILTTLDETDGSPESMIWLGLGKQIETIDQFYHLMGKLTDNGLVTIESNYVTITEKGKTLVARLCAQCPELRQHAAN